MRWLLVAKFDYNDMVEGFIDGFGMCHGYVVDIDIDTDGPWPYMVRTTDGGYHVFNEDELVLMEDKATG